MLNNLKIFVTSNPDFTIIGSNDDGETRLSGTVTVENPMLISGCDPGSVEYTVESHIFGRKIPHISLKLDSVIAQISDLDENIIKMYEEFLP